MIFGILTEWIDFIEEFLSETSAVGKALVYVSVMSVC